MSVLRRIIFCLVFGSISFLGAGTLWAQTTPSPGEPAEKSAQTARESMERGLAEGGDQGARAGWVLFERALDALVNHNDDKAQDALEELARTYPKHPATAISSAARSTLQARAKRKREQMASGRLGPNGEEKTGSARAELVAFQTAHGIALGGEFCGAVECDDTRLVVSMLAVGGGAGLGLSLLASSDGVTPGFATTINSGTLWGAYNGAMFNGMTSTADSLPAALMFSQLAGVGVGALSWELFHPTAGEVSMANSGGIWMGTLALFSQIALNDDIVTSNDHIIGTILGLTDLGIVAGALLSQYEPMTRGRTLVIDSGGALGLLTGMGAYVLINPDFDEPTGFALSAMAGTLAGLGTATFLTRNWDAPDGGSVTAQWGIAPSEEGAMLSLSGAF